MSEIVDKVRKLMLSNRRSFAVVLVWPLAPLDPICIKGDEGIVFLLHPETLEHIIRDAERHTFEMGPTIGSAKLLGVPVFDYQSEHSDVVRAKRIIRAALEKASASFFEQGGTF